MAVASRLGRAPGESARAAAPKGWMLALGFDPSPPVCRASLGVRDGRDRDASVFRHQVDDRVRKPRQQIASSTGVVLARGPYRWPLRYPLDAENQLGAEICAKAFHPLFVPPNRCFSFSAGSPMKADSRHVRLAASSRTRTLSQSSRSAVPDSISSTRRRSSSFQDAAASASSGSKLWIS